MAADIEKMREMGVEELQKEEKSLRDSIWKMRLQLSTGQLQDPHRVRRARRDLARLLTVRRERELAETKK